MTKPRDLSAWFGVGGPLPLVWIPSFGAYDDEFFALDRNRMLIGQVRPLHDHLLYAFRIEDWISPAPTFEEERQRAARLQSDRALLLENDLRGFVPRRWYTHGRACSPAVVATCSILRRRTAR